MKALRYYDADSQFLIFLVSVVFRNGLCAFFRLQCFVNDVLKFIGSSSYFYNFMLLIF